MAAENAPEPMGTDSDSVVDQIRSGSNLPDALEKMFIARA